MAQEVGRKITVRALGLAKEALTELALEHKDGKPVPVARMLGFVKGIKKGEGEYGEFTKFIGQFKGTNMLTGAFLEAPVLLVPGFVENAILGMLSGADVEGAAVAFDLAIKYVPTAATLYEYVAISHVQQETNIFAALEAGLPPLALAAPKVEDAGKAKAKK